MQYTNPNHHDKDDKDDKEQPQPLPQHDKTYVIDRVFDLLAGTLPIQFNRVYKKDSILIETKLAWAKSLANYSTETIISVASDYVAHESSTLPSLPCFIRRCESRQPSLTEPCTEHMSQHDRKEQISAILTNLD